MYSDTRVIIDDWIMNYVKQLLDYIFYTNQKILYERVYKITNTNMDRFLEIFSFVLGFYLSVTAAELLVWSTNNFTDELTYIMPIVFIFYISKTIIIQLIYLYFFTLIIYLIKKSYTLFTYFHTNYKWKNPENPSPEINLIRNSLYQIPSYYIQWLGLFLLLFSIVIFTYSILGLDHSFSCYEFSIKI